LCWCSWCVVVACSARSRGVAHNAWFVKGGTLVSFAILRTVYTALRKLRRLLMLESLVWLALQALAELWLAAGVTGTGSAGFFFVFEVRNAAPVVAILLAVSGCLWLLCASLHVVTWFWLRKMAAEMRRAVSADDAYRRFEEPGNVQTGAKNGIKPNTVLTPRSCDKKTVECRIKLTHHAHNTPR
jgi:hypothetical protein